MLRTSRTLKNYFSLILFVTIFCYPHFHLFGPSSFSFTRICPYNIGIITLPKSGTSMIREMINSIYHKNVFDNINDFNPVKGIFIAHGLELFNQLGPEYNTNFDICPETKIILVRDLYDGLLSWMNFQFKGLNRKIQLNALNQTEKDLINNRINSMNDSDRMMAVLTNQTIKSFVTFGYLEHVKAIIPYLNSKNHIFFYEDLIGADGGGDDEIQKNEIKRLMKALGQSSYQPVPDFQNIRDRETHTFMTGKIREGKKYFNETMFTLFHEYYDDYYKIIGPSKFDIKMGYRIK